MTQLPIRGRCFCGKVAFELSAEPVFACHCHCRSCQHASGAPFVTWATFARECFRLTTGDMVGHSSSPGVVRGHCADCGTSITYRHAERPAEIDVTAAALDDSSFLSPLAHIWLEDKLPWVEISDELAKYRRKPA